MKKIILTLCFVLLLCSCSYGAASDDIDVRQDVFDAKMEAQFNKLHGEIAELRGDIKTLSEILGHSTAATTMKIYVHSSLERKRECMALLKPAA